MYNFKRSLIALAGLLTLIGVVAAITPFTGYGQQSPEAVAATQDVRVVNPATAPVQTKIVNGTTTPIPAKIVNGSSAPVPVTGTVKLGNLTSSPANVRNVETIGQRVHQLLYETIPNGENGSTLTAFYQVPAGKRLVVEHVSALIYFPHGQQLRQALFYTLDSNGSQLDAHYLPIPVAVTDSSFNLDFFSISLPLRQYVDAGMKVAVGAARDVPTGTGFVQFYFSGYLVNAS